MALTPEQKMFNRGYRASLSSPHDLGHWDDKLGGDPNYSAFLDGWSYAASGDPDERALYFGNDEQKAAARARIEAAEVERRARLIRQQQHREAGCTATWYELFDAKQEVCAMGVARNEHC